VPSIHRTSFHKWPAKAGVSFASLWDLYKHEKMKTVKPRIEPVLSDQQKVNRVGLVIDHTNRRGGSGVLLDDLHDWVHVDEKWFDILKDGQKVYLHPTEDLSRPSQAQNKRRITKVMFLAAVVCPRKLCNGVWFDGKIGIWSIVDAKVVQRSSKHRPKGTKVLVPVMVDRVGYKKVMIKDVIPTIKARMPKPEGYTIFAQQDETKPHTKEGEDYEGNRGGGRDDMVVETQPANSPDLNESNYLRG
ncbi:unnamed protein product, partial [Choristocarpus tenellus]